MKLKRLERLEQKIQEQQSRKEAEIQNEYSNLIVEFIKSNMEAKFYFLTIWRWNVGSMDENRMKLHNSIHDDKSREEYLSRERFHKKTGLGNDYRFRIDYPENLKRKFNSMFLDWVEKTGKGKENV